jgi:hypothetical protein
MRACEPIRRRICLRHVQSQAWLGGGTRRQIFGRSVARTVIDDEHVEAFGQTQEVIKQRTDRLSLVEGWSD